MLVVLEAGNREYWVVHMVLSDFSLLPLHTSSHHTPEMQLASFCSLHAYSFSGNARVGISDLHVLKMSQGIHRFGWRVLLFRSSPCAIQGRDLTVQNMLLLLLLLGSAQFKACWSLACLEGLMAALLLVQERPAAMLLLQLMWSADCLYHVSQSSHWILLELDKAFGLQHLSE